MAVRAEISYVMVKPDGVQRGLVGEIISRCATLRDCVTVRGAHSHVAAAAAAASAAGARKAWRVPRRRHCAAWQSLAPAACRCLRARKKL
jgi:hypothetical protein